MSTDTDDWTPEEVMAKMNANGHASHSAQTTNNWPAWVGWSRRVNQRIAAQASTVDSLAEALRETLKREHTKHAAEIAELRAELKQLRAELNTQARLIDMQARLDRLEAAPRSLRAV